MVDWIIQGTHAPFFVAKEKGYFKDAGVTVDTIDAGKGATNVAVAVAGGAYQFGWVDMPSMIRFNAKNPSSPLVAIYISFDDTPLAFITRKDAGIKKPADLDRQENRRRAGHRRSRHRFDSVQGGRRRRRQSRLGRGATAVVRADAQTRRSRRHRRIHQFERSGRA